jgi:hypothetical protein
MMKHTSTITSILFTLALPVAANCADLPGAPAKAGAGVAGIAAPIEKGSHSMMGGSVRASDDADDSASGKVVETMNSGGYTYASLERDGKHIWVAYPAQDTRVGETLTFRGCAGMPNFQSKTLNRTFDLVLFCGAPEKPSTVAPEAKTSPGSEGASAPLQKIQVAKATGANAYTVEEIFAKKASLNGLNAVVRGQVVKVSSGIMGKNWIHLQDGSGSAAQKTHDLVITSSERPAVGDVVTVSGTLATDKDFGGGYKYGVIMEKGSVQK